MKTVERLTFEPNEHKYHLDSREIPSVTQILADTELKVFPDFIKDREWYAQRGTMVHKACELLVMGLLDKHTLDHRIIGYVRSFERAWLHLAFDVEDSEFRVFDEDYWYAGTVDLKIKLLWRDLLQPAIVDIKSGKKVEGDRLQTAGYGRTQPEFPDILRFCLYLQENGSFVPGRDFIEHTEMKDYSVFQAAAVVYNAKRRPYGY